MGFAVNIDNNDLSGIETSELPSIVDFWSPNCPPCNMMLPAVENLAKEYLGRIQVAKVKAEENRDLCKRVGITALPTFIVFRNGQEVNRLVGQVSWSALKQFVETNGDILR